MPPSRNSRYSTTRQKSCQQCSTARAKCDRRDTCGRCASRGLTCTYPTATSRDTSTPSENTAENLTPTNLEELQIQNSTDQEHPQSMAETATASAPGPEPGPSNPDLICPINPDDIQNRWLNAYVPLPGQEAKNYPTNISQLISRTLKSYALKAIQGRPPPFIHPTHLSLSPISACFTLLKLCRVSIDGIEDESVVAEILKREMTRLHEGHTTYSDMELFSTFQAYLIHTMVLFFKFTPPSMDFFRQAMINLQEIACATSRQGLALKSERTASGWPEREAWHIVEAKRRTLYTMYFLDNVLSMADGLPTYIAHELKGLCAPSSSELWAASVAEWKKEFLIYRREWGISPFQLDELWPVSSGTDEWLIRRRQERTDQWLKDVDGFGMVLYAVTSCTYEN